MELDCIKGIGIKRVQKLNENGIHCLEDLLLCFPHRYIDTGAVTDWKTVEEGDRVEFLGEVCSKPFAKRIRRGMYMLKCDFKTHDRVVTCLWMNQPYIFKQLAFGTEFYISGKAKLYNGKFSVTAPQLYKKRDGDRSIIPIYKAGIPTNVFAQAIRAAINEVKISGNIPEPLIRAHSLLPLEASIRAVHFPESKTELDAARYSIAVQHLSYSVACFKLLKGMKENGLKQPLKQNADKLDAFIKSLRFILTDDQQSAVKRITEAMCSVEQMNILLQGDVGSGKTIVAFCAMYLAALNGCQSVLMAPTEILAQQHYKNLVNLLPPMSFNVRLLTASLTKKQKDDALFDIKNGGAQFIIGTHALLNKDIEFFDLRLIITDEQHRFGVAQRGELSNKSKCAPDTVVMSATPIPRTLALTLYGELEQILLKALPPVRAGVQTRYVPQRKRNDMLEYIYQKAECGEQSFIVCPRVEGDESGDLLSAEELYDELCKSKLAPYTALLHGRMKDAEKNRTMRLFERGEIKVLVCTTVIEVGIDVPQATTIAIFNAERYGLSQLHQMRGRVGRGKLAGYCFVLSNNESVQTKNRLETFCKCSDGFELAEYDFLSRGAGEFIGTRQHGEGEILCGIKITAPLIMTAREISAAILSDEEMSNGLKQSITKQSAELISAVALN